MPVLTWDTQGNRIYENGLDRGVLYLQDGTSVPWSGLTSVTKKTNQSVSSIYFDGRKINDQVVPGEISGSIKAFTYPDEFMALEGIDSIIPGAYIGDQKPDVFHLSYRTQQGNDLDGNSADYKLHIWYNVTAIPSDHSFASQSLNPSLIEFEWSITAVPEDIDGFRASAYICIDSRTVNNWLLKAIEEMLYGTQALDPDLMSIADLVNFIQANDREDAHQITITDNGDGSWTATTNQDGLIVEIDSTTFDIVNANTTVLTSDSYRITDSLD